MLGRPRAQRVQAAMDIGVFVFVIVSNAVQHRARFLRGGCAVEINQRMTVHALLENRKIFAERGPIHPTGGHLVHEIICSTRSGTPLYSYPAKIDMVLVS